MPKNLELSYLLDFYGDVLTEKQYDMMDQYYNNDLSLSEIAENAGISRQGVRDAIKRSECILLDLEAKMGQAKRYRELMAGLEKIEKDALDIQRFQAAGYTGDEVRRAADEILATVRQMSE